MEVLNGKYVLERELGRGGMAEVFVGRTQGAEGFSRPIAVKRILPSHSADPSFRKMFIDEARLTARLMHSNVVAVTDFNVDETGRLYLVMEFVDGVDLYELAETHATMGVLPLPVVLFVIREVLAGLAYAHDLPASEDGVLGMVHRDISPSNTLLGWDGSVRVSDFGLAKARAATSASATLFVKGKPSYMSPEQVNCAELDGRSDLFAVGVMLWELLCGARLFSGDSIQATFASVLFMPTPPPRTVRPDIPVDVEAVVMRLLQKKREDRFRNADEALASLAACDAFPKNGRELLVKLLAERLRDRARRVTLVPPEPPAPPRSAPTPAPPFQAPGSVVSTVNGHIPPAMLERFLDPYGHVDPYGAAKEAHAASRRSRRIVWFSAAGAVIVAAAIAVIVQVTNHEAAPTAHPVLPLPQEQSRVAAPPAPVPAPPTEPERNMRASSSAAPNDAAPHRPEVNKTPPESRGRKRDARADEPKSGIREINLDGAPRP